jgi:hypothetical protein
MVIVHVRRTSQNVKKKYNQYIFYNLCFISNIRLEVNMIKILLKYNKEGLNPEIKITQQLIQEKLTPDLSTLKKLLT